MGNRHIIEKIKGGCNAVFYSFLLVFSVIYLCIVSLCFLLIILLIFFCLAIYIPLTFGLCIFGFYVFFNARKYCFFFWCSYYCRAVRLLKCIIHCFLLTGRRYSRFMCTYSSRHSFMLPALAVAFGTPCVCSIYGKSMDFKPKRELKY